MRSYTSAFAIWVQPEGQKLVAYFALAERFVDPAGGGVVTVGGVAKGTCRTSGGRRFEMVVCSARGPIKEIPFQDFTVDPTLGTATLVVTSRGTTHEVTWTATDPAPTAGAGAEAGPFGAGAGVGMGRSVRAAGTLFGRSVEGGGEFDFADLSQSAGGFVQSPVTKEGMLTFSFRRRH